MIDAQNRRVGKKINGALTRQYLYSDALRIVAELDGTGNIVSRFIYATRSNVPDLMQNGGAIYRIISDHLGSPRLVVNTTTGDIADRIDYDEFGIVTNDTNPGFIAFGFAGGLYDQDTKLVRFGARDYDARVGRWTAKDPIGFLGRDLNLYDYAVQEPLDFGDHDGLDIAVIEGGPTADNPIGHTAVAVTGAGVFSFGNGVPLGSGAKDYVTAQSQARDQQIFVIHTTPAQDAAALAYLRSFQTWRLPPGWWNARFGENCSTRSNNALDAAGIRKVPYSSNNIPGSAGLRAMLAGAREYDVPKGSSAFPPALQQFDPNRR